MHMYDNCKFDIIPDNRPKQPETDAKDPIIIGGTVVHTFKLPFAWSDTTYSGKVTYRQGLKKIFPDLNVVDDMVTTADGKSTITVTLKPSYTNRFKMGYVDTECQLQIKSDAGTVSYSKAYPLTVKSPLINSDSDTPCPCKQ